MKGKSKGGRPSRWDDVMAVKLGLAIGRGHKFEAACKLAGLPVSTAYRLLAAARAGDKRFAGLLEATKPTPPSPLDQFYARLFKSRKNADGSSETVVSS
jgi:hypothetical protein